MQNNRSYGRAENELRPIKVTRNYLKYPYGSCLVEFGETHVLCAVTIDENLPGWRKGSGLGWLTAEYAMLPASTADRSQRERGIVQGRTQEIQRLIGRSLRTVVDMSVLGEHSIMIDCDVIQADGGTRTAAITGAWIALVDALDVLKSAGKLDADPLIGQVAAVSVGMVDGRLVLDMDYQEDGIAEIDMNLVMNDRAEFVEIQGTAEHATFSRELLNSLLDLGTEGINTLLAIQKAAFS
ncbi:MAG: ribonuclease PH [Coriobacteriia bacterium]|nr:ribonuclease PH [Coriobacteriia bacterium]